MGRAPAWRAGRCAWHRDMGDDASADPSPAPMPRYVRIRLRPFRRAMLSLAVHGPHGTLECSVPFDLLEAAQPSSFLTPATWRTPWPESSSPSS
jgi:hypothetical protein